MTWSDISHDIRNCLLYKMLSEARLIYNIMLSFLLEITKSISGAYHRRGRVVVVIVLVQLPSCAISVYHH
jgi:hypothetical protein